MRLLLVLLQSSYTAMEVLCRADSQVNIFGTLILYLTLL